jgi:predicted hydrocarbon binding protein
MEKQPDKPTETNKNKQFNPNRMARVVIQALEEILGQAAVNAVTNPAALSVQYAASVCDQDLKIPITDLHHLQAGLESAYGPQAGRGLALRVGRASFKYGLREFDPELGLNDLAFRLLPLQTKIKTGIEAFAALFNTHSNHRVQLERDEKYIFWHIQRCPLCLERQTKGPCCHLAVGLLQEALFWISGGKYFEVEEMNCIACGDSACSIVINRTPII